MTTIIDFLEQHQLVCGIKSQTGMECPGCGIQRAFIALLRGDFHNSLHLHPGLMPFLLTIAFSVLHLIFGFKAGAKWIVVFFSFTAFVMLVNFIVKFMHAHQALNL